jgi:DNA ligase-1
VSPLTAFTGQNAPPMHTEKTSTLLSLLVETSLAVVGVRARSKKVTLIAELLRQLSPNETAITVSYLSGELPQGRIGLGYAAVFAVQAPPASGASLTLTEVDARFSEISAVSGAGSNARRGELLGSLFARATEREQEFLKNLVIGELRQGALEGIMLDAVAAAFGVRPERVRRAAMLSGKLASVAVAVQARGEAGLAEFQLQLFRPLGPMLAQTAGSAESALAELGTAILEYKLDGARLQVHKADDEVRLYTRSLHDVTERAPELVSQVRALPARSLILDGEVLSLFADGRPRPFQVSMRRFGTKSADPALCAELPLSPFFFDVLHADGDDLLDRPASERREALASLVPEELRVPSIVSAEPEQATTYLASALAAGHEGLMAKSLAAPYEAGRRGAGWLKVKQAHTLDLVVLAAEWGSGRRHGKLSNIHLGARDPATGGFVMLGKTFKGMTDAMLAWQTERFLELLVERRGRVVVLRPELVVEVAFDGVQQSQEYPGGLALRFARVRRYRPEKSAAEADTLETVRLIGTRSSGSGDPT